MPTRNIALFVLEWYKMKHDTTCGVTLFVTIDMSRLQEIIDDLGKRKRSVACNGKTGLLAYLEELGFTWSDGKTDGHKVFVHAQLTKLTGGSFKTFSLDCGHKPNREMKFQYVVLTIRTLKKYQSELTEIMSN